MSKYKTVGVVNPKIELNGVFYEKRKLTRNPVVALMVDEYSDKKIKQYPVITPLCWNREVGEVLPAAQIGSYLGMEEEGKQKDWKEEINRIDESDATHNK